MGHPLGTCLVLSLALATVADEDVHLDVQSYNSSVVQLSCTNKGAERESFPVFKDGRKCIDYDSDCSYYNQDYCKFSCEESDDPNVVLFQVELNGSCQEQMTIRCGTVKNGIHLVLAAQSESPVISINNGKPVETSSPAVPVLIVCTITNKCSNKTSIEITGPSGVRLSPVVFNHMQHDDRFTTTALTNGTFFEAGKYTITCKEKGKDGQFAKNLTIEVHEPNSGLMKEEQKQNGKGLSDGTLAAVILVLVALLCIAIFVGLYCRRRRQRIPNRLPPEAVELLQGMSPGSSSYPPEAPTRETPELLQLKDAICGIWDKEDDQNGEKILQAIKSNNQKEVERAMIDDRGSYLKHVQEGRNYAGYFALISSHSLENPEFMAYLTSIIVRSVIHKSTFALVLLEKDLLSNDQDMNCLMNDLRALKKKYHVDAFHELDGNCLHSISGKLPGPSLEWKNLHRPRGEVGIALAWNYFQGYLTIILPEMEKRIRESTWQKKHPGRMSSRFIIIIPESGKIPDEMHEIDERFSTLEALDDGKKYCRAGREERTYNNFVHQITKSKGDLYYFCGEYLSPVRCLDEMRKDKKLTQKEKTNQLELFIKTLKSLLLSNPSCGDNVVVFIFKDSTSANHDLSMNQLCDIISNPNQAQSQPTATNQEMRADPVKVTRLGEGLAYSYYYDYLATVGPKIADRIKEAKCCTSGGNIPKKLFILLPHSCKCHDTLRGADESIIFEEKLEKHEKDVAGNRRNFGCAVHKIVYDTKTYYACVEYCTRVQTMYEMEKKEGLSGLSRVQMAAELRIFYEILCDLLYPYQRASTSEQRRADAGPPRHADRDGSTAPEFSCNIELVYYDDESAKTLSKILVERIEKCLNEEKS